MSAVETKELPEEWGWSTFGKIAELLRGVSYKKQDASTEPVSGKIPILRANNIGNGLNFEDLVYVPEKYVKKEQYIKKGDIIIAMSSGSKNLVGKAAQASEDFNGSYGAFCAKLRVAEGILPKYVAYYYSSQENLKRISNSSSGSNINNLKREHVLSAPIPVAPLEQQKHIVAKIEELFSHINVGIEALKKAKQILKQYRQSVLKAAATGELLGEEFPEDIYKSVQYGLESLGQGWSPKCEKEPSPSEDVWGVIKTTAVQSLEFLQEENKRLPDKLDPRPHLEVKPNDILVTRAGPRVRVGVCCLVKETRKRLMICDKVYRLRPKNNKVLPDNLEIVLNSPQFQDEIGRLKTGISDSGVNLTQKRFVELKIPYPHIKEQKSIVELVYENTDAVSRLENEIKSQLGKAEKHKQSVLTSAFSGSFKSCV